MPNRTAILGLAGLLAAGAGLAGSATPTSNAEEGWRKQALEAAKGYTDWGRVDRLMRWSPLDCAAPHMIPLEYRHTKADDASPHGRKLYSVFAKNTYFDDYGLHVGRSYMGRAKGRDPKEREPAPVGQIVVKEAHQPIEIKSDEWSAIRRQPRSADAGPIKKLDVSGGTEKTSGIPHDVVDSESEFRPIARAKKDGDIRYYKAGPVSGLFLMMKQDPKTPGTDQGWVYATIDADLKTVSSIGKVANCMGCHQEAPHDRLFGLPAEKE